MAGLLIDEDFRRIAEARREREAQEKAAKRRSSLRRPVFLFTLDWHLYDINTLSATDFIEYCEDHSSVDDLDTLVSALGNRHRLLSLPWWRFPVYDSMSLPSP